MPSVGDATAEFADRELIDDALRRLEPEFRAVIVLHYFLGMPLQDVAVSLRIPVGTVKSRLHRSLRSMRVTLEEAEVEDATAVPGGQLA
jgi:RNA polymerase sigma-70 factor (ECF subfamily)